MAVLDTKRTEREWGERIILTTTTTIIIIIFIIIAFVTAVVGVLSLL